MKNRLSLCLVVFLLSVRILQGQKNDTLENGNVSQKTIYSFIIQDSPARLFTMRQFNEDYLSGSQLYSHMIEKNFSPALNYIIRITTNFFVFIPLTHEEGHRSILISKNIGSISQPFFLSRRGGYIDGVTDSTLKNLRDRDFPDYARLYTAGLESDYMLTHREETLLAFEKETYKNLVVEYLMRKAMIMEYYLMIFLKFDIDGAEEKDELRRDIVGNDVYGVIRHLHRPAMAFHRYTRYSDLTPEEISYSKKMGYRAFFNLVNLNMIGIQNIRVFDNMKVNFGMGHTMCPFGDFIDENIWVKYKDKLKIDGYVRQFENNGKWFLAGGLGINDYPLAKKFISSVDIHLWDQPVNLGFNDNKGKFGGAVEWVGRYFLMPNQKTRLKGVSVDLGLIFKTAGFLPEEINMRRHFGFRLGASFAIDN
jgi:hypothetical protein